MQANKRKQVALLHMQKEKQSRTGQCNFWVYVKRCVA